MNLKPVLDLNWFAGVFEGEGTVTITKSGHRPKNGRVYTRPLVSLTSTDFSIPKAFHTRWPGVFREFQPKGNAKKALTWTLNSRAGIARFLFDLLPFIRTDRVLAKMWLVLQDIGARVQGARGNEYASECLLRMEAVQRLNKRGKDRR